MLALFGLPFDNTKTFAQCLILLRDGKENEEGGGKKKMKLRFRKANQEKLMFKCLLVVIKN